MIKASYHHFSCIQDANNLHGWAIIQKLPVNGLKWVENSSKFNEKFIKSYNEYSDKGYFLEVDVEYPKSLFNFHKNLSFLPERKKFKKVEKLVCGIEDKKICCSYKSFKTSIKSRINTKKGAQSNSI